MVDVRNGLSELHEAACEASNAFGKELEKVELLAALLHSKEIEPLTTDRGLVEMLAEQLDSIGKTLKEHLDCLDRANTEAFITLRSGAGIQA